MASYLAGILHKLNQEAESRPGKAARETLGHGLEVAVLHSTERIYLQLMRPVAPGPSLRELMTCFDYWPIKTPPAQTEKLEYDGKYYLRCWWPRRAQERNEEAQAQAQLL